MQNLTATCFVTCTTIAIDNRSIPLSKMRWGWTRLGLELWRLVLDRRACELSIPLQALPMADVAMDGLRMGMHRHTHAWKRASYRIRRPIIIRQTQTRRRWYKAGKLTRFSIVA